MTRYRRPRTEEGRQRFNEIQRQHRAARRQRLRAAVANDPLRLFRPSRLAALLDVDEGTIWRWKRDGILPPPIEIAGVTGWTLMQVQELLKDGRGA